MSEEETPLGIPLYEATCDRSKVPGGLDWTDYQKVDEVFERLCSTRDVFQGGPPGGGTPGGQAGE